MIAFQRSEYSKRIAAAKTRMAERGLDLLFITVPENINYLCGYAGWSFYTHQALLLTAQGPEPLLVIRDMDVPCAHFTAFLAHENVIGYPEEYIGGDKHPMSFIAQVIRERCGSPARIGIEAEASFFTVRAHGVLTAALPGAQFIDSGALVNWLRTVKSPAEIAYLREAAQLADAAIATADEHIAVGVRESAVCAELKRTLIKGAGSFGGSVPDNPLLASGNRTSCPHIPWTDEPIAANAAVTLELGGSRFQYHAGLSRTWWMGTPKAALLRLAETTIEGLNTAIDAVKPGIHCEDVEAAWRRVLTRAGYEKKSRIGYSIGLGFQPNWADGTASLQPGDRTVLEPGMVFHMICGMWKGDDNFVLSETFAVTPSGHEVLTNAPRKLYVKG
jgi:ectoine hydrolase